MNKHPLKSKTIVSALVIIMVAIMSILGVGEKEVIQTYDAIAKETDQADSIKEIVTIIAGAGAIYGRYKVKGGKDE